ncbi:mesoderm-specific transcript protein [Hydra vulgaris]|uniref:mesoderm-specific transcript protein n=1 Tax=Hydra vulgaris TaxID=6087 RepID=UPI001F5F017D|nr:mesoderm-specific transcript protein [Hydra vulgaris]
MTSTRNRKRVTQPIILHTDSDHIKEFSLLNNFKKKLLLFKLRYMFYFVIVVVILIELKSEKPNLSSHAIFWYDSNYLMTYNNHTFLYQDIINLQYPIRLQPVLLILHGQHSYDWRKGIPYFQKKFFRIIIPDLSDNIKQAEMVEQLMMFLNIRHFHLLTHMNGERILEVLLNTKLVSNVKSLCIINGGFSPLPYFASPYFLNNFGRFSVGWYIFKYTNIYMFNLSAEDLYEKFLDLLQSKWVQTETNVDKKLWDTFLTNISIPLHLIYGSKDSSIKTYLSSHNLTKYHLTLLESVGHYPQLEDPELFVREYLKLIKKIV